MLNLTKELLQQLVIEGKKDQAIAEQFGVDKLTIQNLRKEYGISKKINKKIDIESLRQDVEVRRMTIKQLANKYNRAGKNISQILKDNNIERITTNNIVKISEDQQQEIKQLVDLGLSDIEIARKLGLGEEKWSTIRNTRLRKLNLKRQ